MKQLRVKVFTNARKSFLMDFPPEIKNIEQARTYLNESKQFMSVGDNLIINLKEVRYMKAVPANKSSESEEGE